MRYIYVYIRRLHGENKQLNDVYTAMQDQHEELQSTFNQAVTANKEIKNQLALSKAEIRALQQSDSTYREKCHCNLITYACCYVSVMAMITCVQSVK